MKNLDVTFVHLDVTDEATIASAAGIIDSRHGRLDVLVNNAGITRDQGRPPPELPVAALREIYETNVFGAVAVTNAMVGLLRQAGDAVVGNVPAGSAPSPFDRSRPADAEIRAASRLQLGQGGAERDHADPRARAAPAGVSPSTRSRPATAPPTSTATPDATPRRRAVRVSPARYSPAAMRVRVSS
ncbi:SDR family NAD(P)-dependent oxidoreductase [Frankia sp. AgB32]|uniref:SDR family NAD(P)-dependent oxidoreductase n=1 Tax=Frankia sp. AgB32 TaxID=631119 RepID=UPI0034D3DB8C